MTLSGAVGVDQPGLLDTGAVYILMLNANGTVKSDTSIEEGFVETLFGQSVTGLGDLHHHSSQAPLAKWNAYPGPYQWQIARVGNNKVKVAV